MGVLNITPDSFSDGGLYVESGAAVAHAAAMVASGADIIDVGAASSHPQAAAVGAEGEIARLSAVWGELQKIGAPLSVDSFEPQVQLWALQNGAAWLNDINGFAHAEIYETLASSDARLVVMHAVQSRGIAKRQPAPENLWEHIVKFFDTRLAALVKAGVDANRCVLDPGMGFFLGDTPAASLFMMQNLGRLRREFGLPVLVGVSRKSFLRDLAGVELKDSDAISLTAEFYCALQGANYIRTHNVAQLKQVLPLSKSMGMV